MNPSRIEACTEYTLQSKRLYFSFTASQQLQASSATSVAQRDCTLYTCQITNAPPQEAMQGFQDLGGNLKSSVLVDLTTLGRRLPDFSIQLKQLLEAADWKMAEELGRVIPKKVRSGIARVKFCFLKQLNLGEKEEGGSPQLQV